MLELFSDFVGQLQLHVSDDVYFAFCMLGIFILLNFVLDMFRFLLYYICRR